MKELAPWLAPFSHVAANKTTNAWQADLSLISKENPETRNQRDLFLHAFSSEPPNHPLLFRIAFPPPYSPRGETLVGGVQESTLSGREYGGCYMEAKKITTSVRRLNDLGSAEVFPPRRARCCRARPGPARRFQGCLLYLRCEDLQAFRPLRPDSGHRRRENPKSSTTP